MSVLLSHFSFQSSFLMLPGFPFQPVNLSFELVTLWAAFPILLGPHLFLHIIKYAPWFLFYFLVPFTFTEQLFLQSFKLFSFPLFCRIFSGSSYFPHVNTSLIKKTQSTHAQYLSTSKEVQSALDPAV